MPALSSPKGRRLYGHPFYSLAGAAERVLRQSVEPAQEVHAEGGAMRRASPNCRRPRCRQLRFSCTYDTLLLTCWFGNPLYLHLSSSRVYGILNKYIWLLASFLVSW